MNVKCLFLSKYAFVAFSISTFSLPVFAQIIPQATRIDGEQMVRVGLINLLDPQTCKQREGEVARILRAPMGGQGEIRREPVELQHKSCGRVNLSGYAIYYKAKSGFAGRDSLVVEIKVEERNITDHYLFPLEVR